MAVYKSSPVWTMSTEALVEHLASIDAPDSIYWDARSLKKEGRKFQNLSWDHFPRATKNLGSQWVFVAQDEKNKEIIKSITPQSSASDFHKALMAI